LHDGLTTVGRRWTPQRLAWRALEILLLWQERATQRQALAALDDRLLKDMGLNRAAVAAEAAKPFWRA
jgi:uncharacterized protein YjiS (DUF1127 family)